MVNPKRKDDGAPPTNIHIGPATKKKNWLIWLLPALAILAFLFGLSRCGRDTGIAPNLPASATTPVNKTAVIIPSTAGIGSYITGTEALPRTFVFDQVNFDTARSELRAADRTEVNTLASTLKQYPNARVRIVGYADARGAASVNAALGKARADSVKAALVADGIDAGRVETASGGETNPVDTNATASGQAENRRAEVILLQR